jgi:effector-binding domain-containing protein
MHEMPRIAGFAAQRRRTMMPCLRLTAPLLLVMTFAFAASPALAQHAPGGISAPAPLQPGDAFGEDVTLPGRTIVYLKGTSKWDGAFDTLIDAFKSLNEYLDKAGIKPAGPAMTIYTQTDDAGFSFEAAVPIAAAPANPPKGDIAIGQAPSGKALKFVHRGSYEAMDSTYEAITNYLDDKHLDAMDLFIEEYVTDPVKTEADQLVINVFVPVK